MKNCRKCKVSKPLDEFYKQKGGKGGVRSRCKKCFTEYNKQYERKWRKTEKGKAFNRLKCKQYYDSGRGKKRRNFRRTTERGKVMNLQNQKKHRKLNPQKIYAREKTSPHFLNLFNYEN